MFVENSIGFIPKYYLPYGNELRECVENDNSIETLNVLLKCYKYMFEKISSVQVHKRVEALLQDVEDYMNYSFKDGDQEDIITNTNLLLEDFYCLCDTYKIKFTNNKECLF